MCLGIFGQSPTLQKLQLGIAPPSGRLLSGPVLLVAADERLECWEALGCPRLLKHPLFWAPTLPPPLPKVCRSALLPLQALPRHERRAGPPRRRQVYLLRG